MAKGVARGYAAIACMVTTDEVFEMFKDNADDPMGYFRDISTFGGCTAGPAAALENMAIIEEEGLLENTTNMGARMVDNLLALQEKHRVIGDVRGKGLFCGAELVSDRQTKEAVDEKTRSGGCRRLYGAGRRHRGDQSVVARTEQYALFQPCVDFDCGRH